MLFDFEGAGYSDGDYTDFRITTAVADLESIARWALNLVASNGNIAFFGQSLGSAISLAAQDRMKGATQALILWNLSARFEARYPELFGVSFAAQNDQCVAKKGYVIGADFLRDAAELDVLPLADNLKCPTLLLNCIGDSVGDVTIADEAALRAKDAKVTSLRLPATHSFDCQGPLEQQARLRSFDWLDEVTG